MFGAGYTALEPGAGPGARTTRSSSRRPTRPSDARPRKFGDVCLRSSVNLVLLRVNWSCGSLAIERVYGYHGGMGIGGQGLAQRRSAMVAAAEVLTDFGDAVHEAGDADLAEIVAEADAVAARAAAVRAVVTAEAVRRGVVAGSGMDAHGWVREFAPSLRQGGAGQVARLAVEVAGVCRSGGSLAPDAAAEPDPQSPLGVVWAAVTAARVSPGMALSAWVRWPAWSPSWPRRRCRRSRGRCWTWAWRGGPR